MEPIDVRVRISGLKIEIVADPRTIKEVVGIMVQAMDSHPELSDAAQHLVRSICLAVGARRD